MPRALLVLWLWLALPATGQAQTVALAADRDNTLFSEDGGLSNGAGNHLFVGTTDVGAIRRGLLRFDVVASSIPAGSTVTGVTLSLYMSRAKSNTGYDLSLHRVNASWGEGTSHADGEEGTGASATTADATWTHRFWATEPWLAPGGDYAGAASATTLVDRDGARFSWSSATMVADVQAWLDGSAPNHGWIVLGEEAATRTVKRFDSRQSTDATRRPVLTISYTLASVTGACCDAGACADVTAATCAGSYQGDATACASTTCPLPTGACCAASGACATTTAGACAAGYQGNGTTCGPGVCPVPTGACCDLAGGCTSVSDPGTACAGTYLGAATSCSGDPCTASTGACCAADGGCSIADHPGSACAGSYRGLDTTCASVSCPQPSGACCAPDGSCLAGESASCVGSWLGAATTCAPNVCPQPTGACCADDGSCAVRDDASCAASWLGATTSCGPNPCPQPMGACCAADGGCGLTTDAACVDTWIGAATACSPSPCPEPIGACCASDGACAETTTSACAGTFVGASVSCAGDPCRLVLEPYVTPLPRPAAATPTRGASGGEAHYRMSIVQLTQRLHPDLPPTTVWGYDDGTTGGTYPGPTIEARSGALVTVEWVNDLRDETGALRTEHILPVDPCPHGAGTNDPRTVVHLHGGHVAAASDGYPENTILPGDSALYEYPNWQDAAQLWYHDHAMGITRLNVYMGLAGLYTIRDDAEDALALPSGEHEVPLVVQDRSFRPDGSLVYPAEWQEHFFGDTNLVNGAVWPYLDVARGQYRFRILNGANSRTYQLYLSNGASFTLIGVDGGLLEAPATVSELTLGPAERADVIVDFSSVPGGSQIELLNRAPAPFPGPDGVGVVPQVMRFVVQDRPGHIDPIPGVLRPAVHLDEADAVTTRDLELRRAAEDECGNRAWHINGLRWQEITERPVLGTTEIWRFVNPSGRAHPMHMHLVFFEVLDRQAIQTVDGAVVPIGDPTPPTPSERGWKDTVSVGANEIVRVIAHFEDFVGRYPYHCHILEHEDHEMMRQFETTTTCGDGARGLPAEECDDGNTDDGDGCSATCRLTGSPELDAAVPDAGPRDGGLLRDGGPGEDGGCGCRAARSRGGPASLLIALLAAALRVRRRRRA